MSKERTSEEQPRVVDYSVLQRVSQSIFIGDVSPVQFSASLMGPLRNAAMETVPQTVSVRAHMLDQEEAGTVLSMVEFVYDAYVNGESALEISGAILVAYEAKPESVAEFDEETLGTFAEVNGIYTAWPFVRELVSSAASRLGVVGAMLPIWRPPAELPAKGEYSTLTNPAYRSENEDEPER